MGNVQQLQDRAIQYARRATDEAEPWIRAFARAGYAAKGALYVTIGILAGAAAMGSGGATTDSKGALRTLHEQPFGKALLVAMAAGLAGFALWSFFQAIADPEHEGTSAKGLAQRAGRLGSGLIHSGLVVYTVGLLTGGALGDSSDGGGARSWTAKLMSWPAGVWLVGAAGLVAIGFAGHQLAKAYKAKLGSELDLGALSPRARRLTIGVSRFGVAARSVVIAIIGVGLIVAAAHTNPSEAKGVGDALRAVQTMTLGWLLLAVVAFGLVAYGVYQLVRARYRVIRAHT